MATVFIRFFFLIDVWYIMQITRFEIAFQQSTSLFSLIFFSFILVKTDGKKTFKAGSDANAKIICRFYPLNMNVRNLMIFAEMTVKITVKLLEDKKSQHLQNSHWCEFIISRKMKIFTNTKHKIQNMIYGVLAQKHKWWCKGRHILRKNGKTVRATVFNRFS